MRYRRCLTCNVEFNILSTYSIQEHIERTGHTEFGSVEVR